MTWSINAPISSNGPATQNTPLLANLLAAAGDVAVAGRPKPDPKIKPKPPAGVPDSINQVLPERPTFERAGKAILNAVDAMASEAAGANPRTFNFKKYANDLRAAEQKFNTLGTSDALKAQVNRSLAKARSIIPKAEVRPQDLPRAPGGAPSDKKPGNFMRGVQAQKAAADKIERRGTLIDARPYVTGTGSLDRNNAFQRVVGTGNGQALPVYKLTDFPSSFVVPLDLNKVSLVPVATRSAANYTPKGSSQPNLLYTNEPVGRFADRAMRGGVPGIDASKFLGAFNAAFFNEYGDSTTLSHASLVNGKVTSTGKIEAENKLVVIWDNKTGSARMERWQANDIGAPSFSSGIQGTGPELASPRQVAQGFGTAVGKSSASGFVGFDPLALPDGKSDVRSAGTYIGVNAQGKIAVLVSAGDMTPREAQQALAAAGYRQVVALDSGPSSQLSLVTHRRSKAGVVTKDTEPMVSSITNRGVPIPISIQLK